MAIITPNYFHTLQIPIVKGRDFTLQDTKSSQRAVIVSEAFANRYWPNQEAIGKQLNSDLTHEWFTVVGVARDTKVNGLNEKPMPFRVFAVVPGLPGRHDYQRAGGRRSVDFRQDSRAKQSMN